METKEMKKKRLVKTYKTPENVVEAKHEKARKFIQSIDISKVKDLLAKNP